jgi:thermitase
MKKSLLAITMLSSLAGYSEEYLIRYEKQQKQQVQSVLSNYGSIKLFDLNFGSFIKLDSKNELSKEQENNIKSTPGVKYIEVNQIYKTQVEFDSAQDKMYDFNFPQQWGLKNTGRNSGSIFKPGVKGEDINAEKAWEIEMGSEEIVIAIIDTGIKADHPDLQENIYINEAELNGIENVDDDGNGYVDDYQGFNFYSNTTDANDDNGHGTHCAGVIGAIHDNAKQIKGVMKNVKLMPIKFLNEKGSGTLEGAIKSIDYATKMNVHVMSNSWGGGGFSQALLDSINAAEQKGIVFVAAAGNSRNDNDRWPAYPATYENENIISVGAMDPNGKKASYSNYGLTTVDVFAPGTNIVSTYKNNKLKSLSGTSMATPHISGIVGLILSQNRAMTPTEIRKMIIESSVKGRNLGGYSIGGRSDAHAALTSR